MPESTRPRGFINLDRDGKIRRQVELFQIGKGKQTGLGEGEEHRVVSVVNNHVSNIGIQTLGHFSSSDKHMRDVISCQYTLERAAARTLNSVS